MKARNNILLSISTAIQTLMFLSFIFLFYSILTYSSSSYSINYLENSKFDLFLPIITILLLTYFKEEILRLYLKNYTQTAYEKYFSSQFLISKNNTYKYLKIYETQKNILESIKTVQIVFAIMFCHFFLLFFNLTVFIVYTMFLLIAVSVSGFSRKHKESYKLLEKKDKILTICKYFDSLQKTITPKFFIRNILIHTENNKHDFSVLLITFMKWLLLGTLLKENSNYSLSINIFAVAIGLDFIIYYKREHLNIRKIKTAVNYLKFLDFKKFDKIKLHLNKLKSLSAENITIFLKEQPFHFNFSLKHNGTYLISSNSNEKVSIFFKLIHQEISPNKGSICIDNYNINQVNFSFCNVNDELLTVKGFNIYKLSKIINKEFNSIHATYIFNKLKLKQFLLLDFNEFVHKEITSLKSNKAVFLFNLFVAILANSNIITITKLDEYFNSEEADILLNSLSELSHGKSFIFINTNHQNKNYFTLEI